METHMALQNCTSELHQRQVYSACTFEKELKQSKFTVHAYVHGDAHDVAEVHVYSACYLHVGAHGVAKVRVTVHDYLHGDAHGVAKVQVYSA
jgi:hypothetical protein